MSAIFIPFPVQRHRQRHADQAAPIVRRHIYTAQEKDTHTAASTPFSMNNWKGRGRSAGHRIHHRTGARMQNNKRVMPMSTDQ